MQTVILAAGQGTRMRPLTDRRPKPMLPVADRPLMAHTADAAVAAGASELLLVVGYEADDVRAYFGDEYRGVPVAYAVQDEQRGTAHAVRAAREHLEGAFAVLNGDDIYDPASIERLFEAAPAVGTYEVDDPLPYGVFDITDGEVEGIVEKPDDPPSNRVNVGAYVFPAEAREWLDVEASERGEEEITDVLARVVDERSVRAVDVDRWMGVGRPWELLEANEWKLGELDRDLRGEVADTAELRGAVVVEEGATVEPGVVVEGPVLVRAGAHVGPNAYVRGHTLLGEGARVGNAVEVKNSVIMSGTAVPHLSYVGDSVLGRDVNFGAGTTVANLRHDDEPVRLTVKGERVSTGRRKFGVVVGDGAKTGIETTLNAGVTLSTDARVGPNATVTRDR
ncbi:bifunctional sugar-1-phosphate nucleotidylyltransferase/acetyltransferase [Salinirussus salinus]|uniref:bifunctional sugar-1-phosphate nucleotidylyltransferase/acetyltransferase n=1 Tax=Salinirussus salinus TaxID=1198300 RepID=UPI00135B2A42|nr:bifunctional sugar-1-phosphate nucleotidylyltransferase/acetyltransferase [Salinirussus salinus]